MTQELFRELFRLAIAGAVAQSKGCHDPILSRPAALFRELLLVLPCLEADKLVEAIEEENRYNERRRAERILVECSSRAGVVG